MSERPIRDVVLFLSSSDRLEAMQSRQPPIVRRIHLAADLYIERLPDPLSNTIRDACFPRGHNWTLTSPIPAFYAFVREVQESDKWDPGQALQMAVALSRLCNPTSIGLEYAARVFAPGLRHGRDYVIEPAMIAGHGNQAFMPDPAGRDWLSPADVADLPTLTANFSSAPERVKRAAWFHEYAARTEHVPVRLTLAAAGIEALVHVEKMGSTRQFVVGASGLATDCGLVFTEEQATEAYDQRSRYAHGASVRAAPPQVLFEVEAVLRSAMHKALLDTSYAATFASDAAIRARFPL